MTSLALADTNGEMTMLDTSLKPVRDQIRRARDYRRLYFEPTWQLNLAYASGKHWLGWHDQTRTLRRIQELDRRYRGRELVTADIITEYRTTALGELGSDNDRPNLLLRRDDQISENYQDALNRAVGYGWEHEWDGDNVLAQVDQFIVDLGTAAVRCRYDPEQGPVAIDNAPYMNGRPVLNPDEATQLFANGPNPDVTMGPVNKGRICWEPLSAFNILVPQGVTHEDTLPWEAVISVAYLPDVQERYGVLAAGLKEDTDISTQLGVSTKTPTMQPSVYGVTDQATNRLRDHIWLIDWYQRPTKGNPNGRVITFGTNDLKPLDYQPQLPYEAPDGTRRSGIAYFHWWRVTGRFYSRGLVEVLKDSQRTINTRRTQENEIIDRNMPYVIVQKDSLAKRRAGIVNEIVEVDPSEKPPQPVTGIGPGPWMRENVESLREDAVHASGINGPRRGENPSPVTTYSQLALINELDTGKREPIYLARKRAIKQLIEDSVYDIRTYWGQAKHVALAGDDDQLEASVFDATKIPAFFIVRIGTGDAKPRSQAAELAKVTDIWNAALASTAVASNPAQWVRWYKESLEHGEALELPQEMIEDPAEKAELENHYLAAGTPMPIAYYDIHAVHLPRHRRRQDQALFMQDMRTWQTIEQHCQLHMQAAQAQAQAQMQLQAQNALPAAATQMPAAPPQPGAPAASRPAGQ
jgi:hypothetical protein